MSTSTVLHVPVQRRVTAQEDGILRRLHALEGYGATLAPELAALKAEIRSRDLRATIRPPADDTVILPLTG